MSVLMATSFHVVQAIEQKTIEHVATRAAETDDFDADIVHGGGIPVDLDHGGLG